MEFNLTVFVYDTPLINISCPLHLVILGVSAWIWREHISHYVGWRKYLRIIYNTKALKLESVVGREAERNDHQTYCICAYLLYLAGCRIFLDKSNKCVDAVFLEPLWNLSTLNGWSWVAMTLAFLYHYLDKTTILR